MKGGWYEPRDLWKNTCEGVGRIFVVVEGGEKEEEM